MSILEKMQGLMDADHECGELGSAQNEALRDFLDLHADLLAACLGTVQHQRLYHPGRSGMEKCIGCSVLSGEVKEAYEILGVK